jgi:E3 ubiquitin-protein ligase FANCL
MLHSHCSMALAATAAVHQRLVRDFPTMVPDTADLRSYSGFLHVRSRAYRVRVCPESPTCLVHGDPSLAAALAAAPDNICRRIAAAPDAHALLVELRDVVERVDCENAVSQADSSRSILPPASFYEGLLQDLADVGWANVDDMDDSMRNIILCCTDAADRVHAVSVALPLDYPTSPPQVTAALPERFGITWTRGSTSLSGVLSQFRAALEKYQDVFDTLDDLDANCLILEPEKPLRSDAYRRLALGKHSSLRIELDVRKPTRVVPECRFLGSEAAVGPLRIRLNENMRSWDMSGAVTPRSNLETVLSLTLPPPRDATRQASAEDMGLECGICYTYRLDDSVPEVACDRAECARPYHRPCLTEWLQALPDTRQSFETLFGACPYCEHPISVSAAQE